MHKFTFFKSLLVVLCLCVGGNAWADAGDKTTNVNIDFSNAITDGVVAGTVNSITIPESGAAITNGWLSLYDNISTITIPAEQRAGTRDKVDVSFKMAWGNKLDMGSGFRFKDADGEVIVSFQFARWTSKTTNSQNLGIDDFYKYVGSRDSNSDNNPKTARATNFSISVNYATGKISTTLTCASSNVSQTFTADLTNSNPIATIEFYGYGVGNNTERASVIDDVLVTTTVGDYSVSLFNYTINWKCGDEIVKTDTRNGEANAAIELKSSDKEAFTVDRTKYFYVDDDVESKTISDDGSTVVTVNVREAETWKYTVNAVDASSNFLKQITAGVVTEGETVSYYFPRYVLSETELYYKEKISNTNYYQLSFTPAADNEVVSLAYANTEHNVVFLQEAEDFMTETANTSANVHIRCSGGKGGYSSTNVEATTLTAGKYKITGAVWGNGSEVIKVVDADDNVYLTMTTAGYWFEQTSDEFTIYTTTTLYAVGGNSSKPLDYIYIQRTGDATVPVTIGDNGYTTFASAYPLDLTEANLPSGVKAYKAAVDGTTVKFTELNQVVPEYTGILLAGTANENYDITVAAAGTTVEGNAFEVNRTGETFTGDEGDTYFGMVKDSDPLTFGKFNPSEVAIPASKAYLKVATAALAGVKDRLTATFGDETTGVISVESTNADNRVFNLNGQQVAQPVRGLYIVNGKKVLVK